MQNNTNDDVIEIDLQELFGLLVHWLWLIMLCGVIAGGAAFGISNFLITPLYESTTSVYILNKSDSNTVTYSDVQLGTQLTKDYAQMITSRYVLESVIETYALQESYSQFADRVVVETPSDTRMIEITVTDENPMVAQMLANEIRRIAAEHIKNVMDIQAVNTVDEANLPGAPASPNIIRWIVIGAAIGVLLCAMMLVIQFLMDDTIKTSEDVERYMELSTLAMIPINGETDKKKRKKNNGRTLETEQDTVADIDLEEEETANLPKKELTVDAAKLEQ